MKKVNSNKNEKKGKSVRADKTLTPQPAPAEFEEHIYADRLLAKIGMIRTCGKIWYQYEQGVWHYVDRHIFLPVALEGLPLQIRTAGNAAKTLKHIQQKCQVKNDYFRGFYKLDEAGDILVNCANGVVKIGKQGVELLPHSSDYNFTYKVRANYDPKAECPVFDQQVEWMFPGKEDRELFELCGGNILFPDARYEMACVLYGPGCTGKSTLMGAIAYALGPDLVRHLSMTQLNGQNTYFLADLQHVALNICSELEAHEIKDSSLFKQIVSGEKTACRKIRQAPTVLSSNVKIFCLTNHIPSFKGGNGAEERRLRILHVDRIPTEPDITLKRRLESESDGIFLRLVQWTQKLIALSAIPEGGEKSQSVKRVFAISNDPIGCFVREGCEIGSEYEVGKDELVDAYTAYCDSNNLVPAAGNIFLRSLYERVPTIVSKRVTREGIRVQMVSGLRLIEGPEKNN